MNQVIECLTTRRSIRSFKPEQVSEEHLQEILHASMYAPTGMNRQAPVIVVVQDPETIAQLTRMNSEYLDFTCPDPFYGAPTICVVLTDPDVRTCVYDGSLVLGNMMNAAHSVGVGSIWINRARQEFDSEEGKALLRKWGLPETLIGVGHCALGYVDGEYPEAKPRKEGWVVRV